MKKMALLLIGLCVIVPFGTRAAKAAETDQDTSIKLEPVIVVPQATSPRRDLAPGFRGIREPVDRSAPGIDPRELDLAIVPGTAFDPAGNRLGRGAGYYDRFLPRLRAGVPRVGLAFECQIIEETAPAHHDVPMSFIVTEDRTIEPEENNRRR